jgi:hypothetical protein
LCHPRIVGSLSRLVPGSPPDRACEVVSHVPSRRSVKRAKLRDFAPLVFPAKRTACCRSGCGACGQQGIMRAVDFVVPHSTMVRRSRRPKAQRATETNEGREEDAHKRHGHVDRDDHDLDGHIWALIDPVPRAATQGSAPHDRRLPGPLGTEAIMRLAEAHLSPVSTTASGLDQSRVGGRFRCSASLVVEGWVRLGYDERLV